MAKDTDFKFSKHVAPTHPHRLPIAVAAVTKKRVQTYG